jgi:hypothetical protein
MLRAGTILGLWRKGPRASAFLITLFVCIAIFLAQMSGLLGAPIATTIIALLILFSLPITAFVLSRRYDALSSTDVKVRKPRYNVIAWTVSVLSIPFAVAISTIIKSIFPNLIQFSQISVLLMCIILIASLFSLYLSDSRSTGSSVVEKISLPIAIFSVSLYLGSDRHFSYFSDIIPDEILSVNALIRESVFATAAIVLVVVALFSKWEAFQGINSVDANSKPSGQVERLLRAFNDAIRYIWEFIAHFGKVTNNAIRTMFNLQNIVLSFVAATIIYIGVLFSRNISDFGVFTSNIFENNQKDFQNLFLFSIFMFWGFLFSTFTLWISDASENSNGIFDELDGYPAINIFLMSFLAIWVFSLSVHVLTFANLISVAGFSFDPFGLFFAVGAFVFIFAFAAFGLNGSQVLVVLAMFAGMVFGALVSSIFGSHGSIFPFEYSKPLSSKPSYQGNGKVGDEKADRNTDSDGSWINGVWGVDGNCSSNYEIRLSGDIITVMIDGEEDTLQVASKSDQVIETSGGTYKKAAEGMEFSAPVLSEPQMLSRCAR